MHEKMTDDDVSEALRWFAEGAPETSGRLRAHIAALTAERDVLKVQLDSSEERGRLILEKKNEMLAALRERVTALEAEKEQWRASRFKAAQERHATESRLAAMRQRARDGEDAMVARARDRFRRERSEGLGMDAALMATTIDTANYLLGDDAPAPSEMSGLEGEMAEKWDERGCRPSCPGWLNSGHTHVEPEREEPPAAPATSEAFATVREGLAVLEHRSSGFADNKALRDSQYALSLLERRMGAQNDALREVLKLHHRLPSDVIAQLQAALTDAPPVFTLEEVKEALGRGSTVDEVVAILTALRR